MKRVLGTFTIAAVLVAMPVRPQVNAIKVMDAQAVQDYNCDSLKQPAKLECQIGYIIGLVIDQITRDW